jgi:hypothetical protein
MVSHKFFIEKRAYNRTISHLYVRFFYDSILYTGIVRDISNNGMYIKAKKRLPLRSIFELQIPLIEEVLNVSVKVNRIVNTSDIYKGMGIEVLNPPKSYLELADNIKLRFLS